MLNYVVKYWDDNKAIKYCESWKLNKAYHREDGPAHIEYYEDGSIWYEAYHLNGKYHRENGSAYIEYNEDGRVRYEVYYLNGEKYISEEEWFNALSAQQKIDYLLTGK